MRIQPGSSKSAAGALVLLALGVTLATTLVGLTLVATRTSRYEPTARPITVADPAAQTRPGSITLPPTHPAPARTATHQGHHRPSAARVSGGRFVAVTQPQVSPPDHDASRDHPVVLHRHHDTVPIGPIAAGPPADPPGDDDEPTAQEPDEPTVHHDEDDDHYDDSDDDEAGPGRGDPHEDGEHGDPHDEGEQGDPHDDAHESGASDEAHADQAHGDDAGGAEDTARAQAEPSEQDSGDDGSAGAPGGSPHNDGEAGPHDDGDAGNPHQ